MIKEGMWKKKRRRKKHRSRREPKRHRGEMVQLDGSPHKWFQQRGQELCLMNMVDDATGTSHCLLTESETTRAAMIVLWQWIEKYGIPKSLYVDRHNIYIAKRDATVEEQLNGEEPLTQFGRACKKLGIKIIPANSPQAKGRVERKNAVYQDRFIKEMRLLGIDTIEGANRLLQGGFIEELNGKFAREPSSKVDYHREVPEGLALETVFCFQEQRTISNDWVVRYENRLFQIKKDNTKLPPVRKKVVVCELLDGRIQIRYRGNELEYEELTAREPDAREREKTIESPIPALIPPESLGEQSGVQDCYSLRS